jgi:hypothetical protein
MNHGLYYCDTTHLSLGAGPTFKFRWLRLQPNSLPLEIVDCQTITNEFNDDYTHVELKVGNSVPMKTLRYRHRCGETGFDYFSANEQGHPPDVEMLSLLRWVMGDGWTWDNKSISFVSFDERLPHIAYPCDFYANKGKFAPALSFHSPTGKMREMFIQASKCAAISQNSLNESPIWRFYGLRGQDKLDALLQLMAECRMIINWHYSYGCNPIVMATDIEAVLLNFKLACERLSVPLHLVNSESNLPEW